MKVHDISNIYNNICNYNNKNNNRDKQVYKLLKYRLKEWEHKLL
jgi:hypothetical protein